MPRFLLKLSPLFFGSFIALSIIARVLGTMLPPNSTLIGFTEGCQGQTQPCWYGIVPGTTTVKEALQVMAFAGEPDVAKSIFSRDYTLIFALPKSSPYCQVSLDFVQDIVVQGQLSPCQSAEVHLGDLAILLDNQEKYLSLPPDNLVYGNVSVDIAGWPAPYSRIHFMRLLSPDTRFQRFPWLGFASRSRYCQLVPSYPLCR